MESSRELRHLEKTRPEITLKVSSNQFIKGLEFGEKGELDISAIITKERVENGDIIKSAKIVKTKKRQNARM